MGIGIRARVEEVDADLMDGWKWIQCATAGRLLEVSRQRVYQLCRTGVLASRFYDGRRYVSMKSVIQRIKEMVSKEDG